MPAVRYTFVSAGADAVANQFLTIESAAKRSKKAADESTAAVERASRKPTQGASAAAGGAPAGARGPAGADRLAQRAAADTERAARRTADAQIRESRRAATEQGRNSAYVAKIRDRHFTDEQKAGERAAKRTADAQARESKRSAAEQVKNAQYLSRIRDRHFASEQRAGERSDAKKARELASNQRTHTRNLDAFTKGNEDAAETRSSGRKASARNAVGAVGAVGIAAGAAALGVVGQATREVIGLHDAANRISVNARGAGEEYTDPKTLVREFQRAALRAPGIKADDIAEGAAGYVAKTGKLDEARQYSSTFATFASSTGSRVQDIADTGAELSTKFGITGIQDMQEALASLAAQGRLGAFEIADLSKTLAGMAAAGQRFGLKGSEGIKTLGGLSQIARTSTGSPEKAATSVEAMFRQFVQNSASMASRGVHVFKKGSKTETNDIRGVIVDEISKNKGNLVQIQKDLGDVGIGAISPLIATFNNARNGAKGKDGGKATEAEKTAAGVAALNAALASAIDAPGTWADEVKNAARAQQSAGAQLDGAWEQLKATVSDRVVPGILPLVPAITRLATDGIGPAIDLFKLLVGAGQDVLSVLKFIGLAHPKVLTPTERLAKAKDELSDFREKFDARNHLATPEETKEKLRLEKNVADATETAKPPTSHEEFVAAYSAAGREGGDDAIKKRMASAVAAGIEKDPTAPMRPLGSTDAQDDVIARYQKQLAEAKGGAGAGAAGPAAPSADVEALNRSAAGAAATLAKIAAMNAPSIVHGIDL